MYTNEEYSKMSLDELMSEEKKLNSQKTITAVLIGFLVGVAVWSATHEGSFIATVGLLIFAFIIGTGYNKKRKNIQIEISRRNTVD